TAPELRATSAMALVVTGHPAALTICVGLLVDPEPTARTGGIRGLVASGRPDVALLLRFVALRGDDDPGVLAEAFAGLLGFGADRRGAPPLRPRRRLAAPRERRTRRTASCPARPATRELSHSVRRRRAAPGCKFCGFCSIKFVDWIVPGAFNPVECATFSCGTPDALSGTDRFRLGGLGRGHRGLAFETWS